jgi:hypothetical protein
MHYNILTKLVKYIKATINTYMSLLRDKTCSMLVVSK